jgi:hypothetical protein
MRGVGAGGKCGQLAAFEKYGVAGGGNQKAPNGAICNYPMPATCRWWERLEHRRASSVPCSPAGAYIRSIAKVKTLPPGKVTALYRQQKFISNVTFSPVASHGARADIIRP